MTVGGTSQLGTTVTGTSTATVSVTQTARIAIDKSNDKPAGVAVVGETITYNLAVTNPGNVTMTNVEVSGSFGFAGGVGV